MKKLGVNKTLDTLWATAAFVLTVLVFFPVLWMILCATRPNQDLFVFPVPIIQKTFTLDAFRVIFSQADVPRSLFNTVFVSLSATLFCLIIAAFGAFGMSRYRFKGRRVLQFYILMTQMLPVILIAIPFFKVFMQLGLYDTKAGLILAYTSFSLPFCSLTLLGFFGGIPRSLDEAAQIDGCTHLGSFIKIIMPISKTGLVSTGIFAFVTAWNEYLMALILTNSNRSQMLVVVIGKKIGQYDIAWNELMAITALASLPLIIMYAFMQKSFMRGLTAGSVKM
ncbi:MAG: carbohydrate ABC transporter permease [Spirochaetales bacterium]|nr:carbohydrate ABC transporter permease [Spirochaetales bacterium]